MPLNLEALCQLQQPPAPFTPGNALFWDDPYISTQLLAAHLDQDTAAASRTPIEIDQSVAWLIHTLDLQPSQSVLDLGCGPGLYTSRLAAQGIQVTGIDYSRNSIDYATHYAHEHHLDITYRYQDYLTLDEVQHYDVALLIYGDFCVLAPAQRSHLLRVIHRALRERGHFVLDVSTRIHRSRHGQRNAWEAAERGFWRPNPHLVLTQGFDYPEQSLYLDQYIVIEPDGATAIYRNWFQDYNPESITDELTAHGFRIHSLWDDLRGTPSSPTGEWIGVIAAKG